MAKLILGDEVQDGKIVLGYQDDQGIDHIEPMTIEFIQELQEATGIDLGFCPDCMSGSEHLHNDN